MLTTQVHSAKVRAVASAKKATQRLASDVMMPLEVTQDVRGYDDGMSCSYKSVWRRLKSSLFVRL